MKTNVEWDGEYLKAEIVSDDGSAEVVVYFSLDDLQRIVEPILVARIEQAVAEISKLNLDKNKGKL